MKYSLLLLGSVVTLSQSQCTNPRVRKEWHQLTSSEKDMYVAAITELAKRPASMQYADPSRMGYHDFAITHSAEAYWSHGCAKFYPYHRAMLFMFEEALISTGVWPSNMGIPYFDWSAMSQNWWTSDIWSSRYFGSINSNDPDHCVLDGIMARDKFQVAPDPIGSRKVDSGDLKCLRRNAAQIAMDDATSITSKLNVLSFVDLTSSGPGVYYDTTNYHSTGHFAFGGAGGDMANPSISPNDPTFFLHHGFVDKYWWRWQQQCEQFKYDYGGNLMKADDPTGNQIDNHADVGQFLQSWPFRVEQVLDTQNGLLCYTYSKSTGDLPMAPLDCPTVVKPAASSSATTTQTGGTVGPATSTGASSASPTINIKDSTWLFTGLSMLVQPRSLGSQWTGPGQGSSVAPSLAGKSEIVVFGRRDNDIATLPAIATGTVTATEAVAFATWTAIATGTTVATQVFPDPFDDSDAKVDKYLEAFNADNSTTVSYTLANHTIEIPAGFKVYEVFYASVTALNITTGNPKRFFPTIERLQYIPNLDAPKAVAVGQHPCHLAYPPLLDRDYVESMGMSYVKYYNGFVLDKMALDAFNADNCTTMFSPSSMMSWNMSSVL
ncbi:hypothetical protein BC830DRAFT_1121509 [Chytriomyces sp. MP71]|nr:hypothetical protein BC830DRAFT_1121509 [Chytriomyces sp. MP71]